MVKILWTSFESKGFTFSEAGKVLEGDDSRMVAAILSELKRAGWLDSSIDAENPRKRKYRFTKPDIMREIAKIDVRD